MHSEQLKDETSMMTNANSVAEERDVQLDLSTKGVNIWFKMKTERLISEEEEDEEEERDDNDENKKWFIWDQKFRLWKLFKHFSLL